jgi:hypothetical protein
VCALCNKFSPSVVTCYVLKIFILYVAAAWIAAM